MSARVDTDIESILVCLFLWSKFLRRVCVAIFSNNCSEQEDISYIG